MTHTLATQRVIDLLTAANIPYEAPVPDVILTPAGQRAFVRMLMAPLPHYMKYLDRGHSAVRIRFADGSFVYRLGRGDSLSLIPALISMRVREQSPPLDSAALFRGVSRITLTTHLTSIGTSGLSQHWNGSSWVSSWSQPVYEDTVTGNGSIIETSTFAGVSIGKVMEATGLVSMLEPVDGPSHRVTVGSSRWVPTGVYSSYEPFDHNGPNPEIILHGDMFDVVCGPVCFEHGEIWPRFAFFAAKGSDIANRMRAVLAACSPPQTPSAELEKALVALNAMKEEVVSFRSDNMDVVQIWPELKSLGGDVGLLPLDEEFTEADRSSVVERWDSGKWFVSIGVSDNSSTLLFSDPSEAAGGVRASYRPDGVHLSSLKGTIKVDVSAGYGTIRGLKADGVAVTDVTSPLSVPATDAGDRHLYDLFKSAFDEQLPSGDVAGAVRRAVIGALTSKPIVETEESLPLLALVTPQTFWAKTP